MEQCSQHDMLMQQLLELSNQVSQLKSTLIRVIIGAMSACSALMGTLEVILCI